MVEVAADLAGYADAQHRLRQQIGQDLVFYGAPIVTWPAGTPIDPDTGRPHDPTIQPQTSSPSTATVRCRVAFRAAGNDADVAAVGIVESTHVLAITDAANRATVEPMLEFDWQGERYLITSQKPDESWQGRWLIYGRRK